MRTGFPLHLPFLNLLAFDTSTERLSIAVTGGVGAAAGGGVLVHEGAGGAQASASLIPAIQALLAQAGLALGELDAIVFGRGPGSFTGLRTACAVAQGLAFGADVPVLPMDTLLAVAEDARGRHGCTRVMAVLDARMGEVYSAGHAWDGAAWQVLSAPRLHAPADIDLPDGWMLAGSGGPLCAAHAPGAAVLEAMPDARAMLRLAPALLARGQAVAAPHAMPLYLRDKVAQTTAERAALRQAAERVK